MSLRDLISTTLKFCFGTPARPRKAEALYKNVTLITLFYRLTPQPLIGNVTSRRFNFNSPRSCNYASIFNRYYSSWSLPSESPRALFRVMTKVDCNSFSSYTMRMAENKGSLCRQNYHEECEALVNEQISVELHASYVYLSMAYYFDREDVAYPGIHKYFKKASDEEREHAQKFMHYQNSRGGRILLKPIAKPTRDEWTSPLDAITAALELEKSVNQALLKLHSLSSSHNDAQLCDFLESHFLQQQVTAQKELSDYITQGKRCGKGLGEFIFDKELDEKS